jgi:thiosulfate/3-mercaptopyruvate sulfurtransferase
MKRIPCFGFVSCLFALLSGVCAAQSGPAAHPEMLVSTQWLADHLNDPKVVVVEVADERTEYDKGHIPGARFLSSDDHIVGHQGLMIELPSPEKLKASFEKLGISDDSRVIIYTPEWYPGAARAYFTFDYIGHDATALLDGSIQQWRAEHRAWSTENVLPAKGNLTVHVRPGVRAMLDEVKALSQPSAESKRATLVDSRPRRRYDSGHIAGATHIFWEETVVDPKRPMFLSPEKLRVLLQSRGITPGRKLVTYCEVGLQASHNYFVAKYLGYDGEMYDGSYYEWNQIEHLPVVKGGSAR